MSELAEGARLEIVYTPQGYLGFESPSLRQNSSRHRRFFIRGTLSLTRAEGWQSG